MKFPLPDTVLGIVSQCVDQVFIFNRLVDGAIQTVGIVIKNSTGASGNYLDHVGANLIALDLQRSSHVIRVGIGADSVVQQDAACVHGVDRDVGVIQLVDGTLDGKRFAGNGQSGCKPQQALASAHTA